MQKQDRELLAYTFAHRGSKKPIQINTGVSPYGSQKHRLQRFIRAISRQIQLRNHQYQKHRLDRLKKKTPPD